MKGSVEKEPGAGYRPFVLEELARWGVVPRAGTDPAAVYSLLKSIYSFEIRRMKARHREKERVLGPQPLEDYRRGLFELKERYRVLKLAWWQWVE
jgi:hypothetical protein